MCFTNKNTLKKLMKNSQIQLVKNNLNLTTPALNRFAKPSDINTLVALYGTPLYLIDEDTLHAKARELHNAYSKFNGPVKVAYSMKANFSPAILRTFINDGITFDLTSIGELRFLKECKGDPENIIYTSVTEELQEYSEVLQAGVRRVVVSSFNGITNLAKAASKMNIKPLTMIRVNPEVGVKAEVRASYRNGKFGVPLNGGTIDSATKKVKKEYQNFQINTFDIGGGTPVFYHEPVPTPSQMAENYLAKLNRLAENHGKFTLIVESGRFLVAESSILVSRIVNTKEYNEHRIVIVDAGYHLLLDAALLKQEYPQEVVPVLDGKEQTTNPITPKNLHLAGRLCDTYDVFPLSNASSLSEATIGRYISFYNVGAYSTVFNMPFHCQTKPPIIMKTSNGDYKIVRRKLEHMYLFEVKCRVFILDKIQEL